MKEHLILVMVSVVFVLPISISRGEVGDVVAVITPTPSGSQRLCAIGLAFDGTNLYVNRCSDPNIYAISPQDGSLRETRSLIEPDPLNPRIPEWPAAMAYDPTPTHKGLWIATQMGVGGTGIGDCGDIGMPVYFWAFEDDSVTLVFTIPRSHVNPATGGLFLSDCTIPGLAYDEDNGKLWISDDRNRNVGIFQPDGVFMKGLNAASVHISLFSGSGLRIGNDKLYLANGGCDICGDVFRAFADTDPLVLIDQLTEGNLREQDMACDPVTFAPTDVMWVRTDPRGNSANDIITAYEIEPGGCGPGLPVGACCDANNPPCRDVSQAECGGNWTEGVSCAALDPPCFPSIASFYWIERDQWKISSSPMAERDAGRRGRP